MARAFGNEESLILDNDPLYGTIFSAKRRSIVLFTVLLNIKCKLRIHVQQEKIIPRRCNRKNMPLFIELINCMH